MDPLTILPAEIVLRILDFASLDSLAHLTRLNRAWHAFIDTAYQDAIFTAKLPFTAASPSSGGSAPRQAQDYLKELQSFARYGEDAESWKDVCRHWTLLLRNWDEDQPVTTESIIRVDASGYSVWRFKPDFRRRLIISTSQGGGVFVTDMDTGALLWSLQGEGQVRPYAHLEYEDGTAVWDRYGNTLEVWKTDLPGLERGEFRNVGLLHHDETTRGFQLSHDTLCVVSTERYGFVYDVLPGEVCPKLRTRLEIPEDAVGHLSQSKQAVMYSMGDEGYHVYDKTTAECIGQLRPHLVDPFKVYHINHPVAPLTDFAIIRREILHLLPSVSRHQTPYPPRNPQSDRLVSTRILPGPLRSSSPVPIAVNTPPLASDDWGAGMLDGRTMVGVSRGGRLVICADWERAVRSEADFAATTSIVECGPGDGADFDLGGWLSVHRTPAGKRVIFEVKNKIYMIALDAAGRLDPDWPVQVAATSLPGLSVSVSFMGVYDDCIMSTFTILTPETQPPEGPDENGEEIPILNIIPSKVIRVLSFAPEIC